MDLPISKKSLRSAIVSRILALDPEIRAVEEETLRERFPDLPDFANAECVLLYASAFPEEFDTTPLLRTSLALGKTLVCPKVDRIERRLRLYRIVDPEIDLVPGMRGIPEPRTTCEPIDPQRIDWVLVPGLAFDGDCYRLGRGAGHYDRLLPTLRPDVPRWALAFEEQWIDELPIEPHDIPLDGVVSPSRSVTRPER